MKNPRKKLSKRGWTSSKGMQHFVPTPEEVRQYLQKAKEKRESLSARQREQIRQVGECENPRSRFEVFLAKKEHEYGSKFDGSELDGRFVPYYNSQQRIKVDIFGDVMTGTVGVTTGWRPVFLLMRTKRSTGSSDILDKRAKILGTTKRNPQSVYMVVPLSRKAKFWVDRNVGLESWQWMGPGFAVEWRYVDDLVQGMEDSGLVKGKDFDVN